MAEVKNNMGRLKSMKPSSHFRHCTDAGKRTNYRAAGCEMDARKPIYPA